MNHYSRIRLMALGIVVCLAGAAISAPVNQAGKEFLVTEFGAKPDSRLNAVAAVQKALAACRGLDHPVLVFPKGRYDFWPQYAAEKEYFESNTTANNPKRLAIFIENQFGLTIDGGGSTFVFHDRIQPFTVDHSSGVTIRGCAIDWDIPLSAEAVVEASSGDELDLRLDDRQFPYAIEAGKLVFVGEGWKSAWWGTMEFDGKTLEVVAGTGDDGCLGPRWNEYRAEELERGRVRLHIPFRFGRRPAPGNILVLRHSERDHAGLFIADSKDVTVEDVALHHCAGLGLLAQFTENLTVRGFRAVPAPSRRVLSGHDDGIHISNCRGLVLIEGCRFHGLMDDPINIHGTSVRVLGRPAPDRLRARFMHNQSTGMVWARPGDRIGFLDPASMRTIGEGRCLAFTALDRDSFEIVLDKPAPAGFDAGAALENLTWAPEAVIRDNDFESNRARGLLVSTAGRVLIEKNRFASSGSAILIAGDANYWFESGAVRDVTIRGNIFGPACLSSTYQFGEGIISIFPMIPKPDPAFPYHRGIRIEGNEFHPFDYPVLYALSVEGLVFSGNTIIRGDYASPHHSRKATVTLESCRGVRIEGNKFVGDVLGRNIVLNGTPASAVVVGPGQGWIR